MGQPIQNPDQIDIIGAREDGGVDLMIVSSSRLEATEEHKRLLLDKIQSYLHYIASEEFRQEFRAPSPDRTEIAIVCSQPPDPVIIQMIEKVKPWVRTKNARLVLRPVVEC